MKISIFGLGYVGAVSAGCLAKQGHHVLGVDTSQMKVDQINSGQTPIIEQDIGEIISTVVAEGRLRATSDVQSAVQQTDMSMICVGTPSQLNGSLDLSYVRRVCEQIGEALNSKADSHLVVVRSTMLPGSMWNIVIPTLEQSSGKKVGQHFGVCNNPEFLREGTAVYDYFHPPKIVIGQTDAKAGDLLASVYADLQAPMLRTTVETAEMVKYTDNVWHALKVCFANEIGNICKEMKIDSHQVMDIFCHDTKLNLSPYYMKPGFAFGGSCLPKDVRALTYKGRNLDLNLPVLNAILPSNREQMERAISMIVKHKSKKVGVLGFSFKAGTDDLRESPMVEIIERLIGKGYDVKLYDKNVKLASLVGANKDYILNVIPHVSSLMVDTMESVLEYADIIVIGNGDPEFRDVKKNMNPGQVMVDLVRVLNETTQDGVYEGICW